MKFFALIFCFCLAQICAGLFNGPAPDPQAIRDELSKINSVSEQFVEDINVMLDEYQSSYLVKTLLKESVSRNHIEFKFLLLFKSMS